MEAGGCGSPLGPCADVAFLDVLTSSNNYLSDGQKFRFSVQFVLNFCPFGEKYFAILGGVSKESKLK